MPLSVFTRPPQLLGYVARCLLWRVAGGHLTAQMPTELVLTALEQALTLRRPAPGLVVHADRGSQQTFKWGTSLLYQCTSLACRQRTEAAGALVSYVRAGNPYDNAQAEARWSALKIELLPHGGVSASLKEARLAVAYYLDPYFNFDRRHPALGYHSPHQLETDLFQPLP